MNELDLSVLTDAAIAVASWPPEKPSGSTYQCLVPWSRLEALRAALDRAGIAWTWGR